MNEKTFRASIVIPTYRRERVLVETIHYLMSLKMRAEEIIVVDQSESHGSDTEGELKRLHSNKEINWLLLDRPSIPRAMNIGLVTAKNDIVIFLDDDIKPDECLVEAHMESHTKHHDSLVAGRVIQSWEIGKDTSSCDKFYFSSKTARQINEFMGGNFSVSRKTAIKLGGFDENFVKVAYRFEAEFASRFLASGRKIYFEPSALIYHLKALEGGTRSYGNHLQVWSASHSVGAYYYALCVYPPSTVVIEVLKRPLKSIMTRYHLSHVWQIPATLFAELSGVVWAILLRLSGKKLLKTND